MHWVFKKLFFALVILFLSKYKLKVLESVVDDPISLVQLGHP